MHAKGLKLTYTQILKVVRKSKKFVQKWVKQYKEVKNVDNLSGRDLTRASTSREHKTIIRLFERNPTLTSRQALDQLCEKDITVGINTIRRHLHESNVKHRSTIQVFFYTKICHKTTGVSS